MRISLTILFVSLTTLLGVATIYTLSRPQSNEATLQSNNDYPPCAQLENQCHGSGYHIDCQLVISNTCNETLYFTITSTRYNKPGYDTTTTGCLGKGKYTFLYIDQYYITQITQKTCSGNN